MTFRAELRQKSMKRIPIAALILLASYCMGQQNNQTNPCAISEQRQFDFWLGEWDASWPGNKPNEVQHGTNSIKRILDDCVVEETFSGGTDLPLRGRSVSLFDTRARRWKQTWVDNQGGYLDFVGDFDHGQMILSRSFTRPDGVKMSQRMVWKNITPDEFDWSWESSKDDGKTWQVAWPIHYKRRK
jgi:hypothetical protein